MAVTESTETYLTGSPEETLALGVELAKRLRPPCTVLLIGDLGAGKTVLAKGIVSGLGAAAPEDVASPTFALMHEFGDGPKVYHLDLYRLDRSAELGTLGLEELWDDPDAVVLVEWGEKFEAQMPHRRLEVRIDDIDDDRRRIRIRSA